jgi:hypothetical protein
LQLDLDTSEVGNKLAKQAEVMFRSKYVHMAWQLTLLTLSLLNIVFSFGYFVLLFSSDYTVLVVNAHSAGSIRDAVPASQAFLQANDQMPTTSAMNEAAIIGLVMNR